MYYAYVLYGLHTSTPYSAKDRQPMSSFENATEVQILGSGTEYRERR